jgi:dUTP pyrophosphatase
MKGSFKTMNDIKFNCRVCGANQYHIEDSIPETFSCAGCSSLFRSPAAFSVLPIKVMFIGENAKIPEKNKEFDSGFDLFSAESYNLAPGETHMFKTNIAIELPPVYEAQVRARSGLAKKHGIQIANGPGTIDYGYRNNIGILLYNSGTNSFKVEIGDRIAQLVPKSAPQLDIELVTELSETDRGLTGFGDSGIKGSIKN